MHVRFLDSAGYVRSGTLRDGAIHTGSRTFDSNAITYLPPCEPTKVLCLARNVIEHADEHDAEVPERPEYFLKPPSAVAAPGSTVTIPSAIDEVEHEAELAAVIGRQAQDIPPAAVPDIVEGLTICNDLSNRADQRTELNWVRGKAFDGSLPIGPGIVPLEAVPEDAAITLHVNGDRRQAAAREAYVFDVEAAIAEASQYLTLEPGDVIALGTPAGVTPLAEGDRVSIDIEGIGTLSHTISYA